MASPAKRVRGRAPRIGVFGGTFDPPHVGHVAVARRALDELSLDVVLWVPASISPGKSEPASAPRDVRRRMAKALCDEDPRFQLFDWELRRSGVSYTVDTLRELRRLHPGARLYLIVGSDQWERMRSWRSPREIASLAEIVVAQRPGPRVPLPAGTLRLPPLADCSSRAIRAAVARGEDVSAMLAPSVFAEIMKEGLYRKDRPAGLTRLQGAHA